MCDAWIFRQALLGKQKQIGTRLLEVWREVCNAVQGCNVKQIVFLWRCFTKPCHHLRRIQSIGHSSLTYVILSTIYVCVCVASNDYHHCWSSESLCLQNRSYSQTMMCRVSNHRYQREWWFKENKLIRIRQQNIFNLKKNRNLPSESKCNPLCNYAHHSFGLKPFLLPQLPVDDPAGE